MPHGAPGLLRRLLLPPRPRGRRRSGDSRSRTGPPNLGFGSLDRRSTCPARATGLVPDPGVAQRALPRAGVTDRPWSVGDNINLSVGQGDLEATPLQLAVAYAAIANGGEIVRPHVGLQVEDPPGRAIQEIDPAPQQPARDRARDAQRDHRGPPRGRDGAGRHLVPDLRRLPGRHRRQDRNRGARRERRGPVLVRGARAVSGPRGRRRRHDRARAASAPTPRRRP